MRLAFIPPFSLLETTFQTDYQLMLPQLVETDERYDYVYMKHCRNPETYVILDNGAAENEQVDNDTLMNVAASFGVDEVIMPDTIRDEFSTIQKASDFWQEFGDYGRHVRFMFVAQGENIDGFYRTIKWAADQEWIDTIAIPRHAVDTCGRLDARTALVHYVLANTDKEVHVLGGSPSHPHELCILAKEFFGVKQVRGMDTSMPFNYAWWNEYVLSGAAGFKRPDNYFTLKDSEFDVARLNNNLETMKRWASGNE